MGRRAADLTTSVPVLGVPALVGVRGWKATGGDRSGGALWGLQCSVGVQTSPGISRPPTQLTDTLSDNISQTSNSYITKETEYKEVLLLTKSDKEKKAILKQKSGESKTKKEVTFKALGGEASKDVACCQRNSRGTFCYSRAIKTNPHIAGNATNARPNYKSVNRYTNGSVVDSEAIGGITVDNDEAEPVKGATCHRRDLTRLQGHYSDSSGKTLPLSAARPFSMPQKICNHCGGRQSVTNRAVILGEKSPTPNAFLREKSLNSAFTSLSTSAPFQIPHTEKNLKANQQISNSINNTDNRTQITVNPQILYVNEELRYRKTPHPACPVHSKGNLVTLSNMNASRDGISIQPTTVLHAKTITVTKATIETRQDDSSEKCCAKPPQDRKIPRPTSLPLTPQMAIATKPNNPHSHTYPKRIKTTQHISTQCNEPQNVCVSVHATPENTLSPPSHLYTVATGTGNTSSTNALISTPAFNSAPVSTESIAANVNAQHKPLHSKHTGQINVEINTTNSPKIIPKCPTLSLAESAFDQTHKSKPLAHLAPASPPFTLPDHHKLQEKTSTETVSTSLGKMPFTDTVIRSAGFPAFANPQHPTTPHPPLSILNHKANSNQIAHKSNKHKSMSAQIIHPNSSHSEPMLHAYTSSLHMTSSDSKAKLPPSTAPSSTLPFNSTLNKNIALRNTTFNLKNSATPASSRLCALKEKQNNFSVSSTNWLQSTDTAQVVSCNEAPDTGKPPRTEGLDIRAQSSNKSGDCGVVLHQKSNSTPLHTLSKPQIVSKDHNRGSDTSTHNPKSTNNPTEELSSDKNKLSANLINELVVHESKDHKNSNPSQVANLQNCISLIKSSSSCLQGCINTEQQKLAHYQGCTETEHEGHCATCPPVKTARQKNSNTEQFALGVSARHANVKLKTDVVKETHPNNSTLSVTAQTNCEPITSNTNVKPIIKSSVFQNSEILLPPQARTRPERSFTAPTPCNSNGEPCMHTGPDCNSIFPSSTKPLASHPHFQSREVEAINSPAPPQPCPEDTSLAHSHPADAALLLPPSPQCCKSAALQQRLETVEASLAANKDRITTLLNIIHDLETCHTPTSSRQSYKTGQDLKNCSTCQKTACVVYRPSGKIRIFKPDVYTLQKKRISCWEMSTCPNQSATLKPDKHRASHMRRPHKANVEYDFRQQERRFLEVLNHSASGHSAFSVHLSQPLTFSLLRNVIIKNLTKTKVKSKKLCKTLFKWLPRKTHKV